MKTVRSFLLQAIGLGLFILLVPLVLMYRLKPHREGQKPRLFWGTTSIISLPMNVKALRRQGYQAEAVALANPGFKVPDSFDIVIEETAHETSFFQRRVVGTAKAFSVFFSCLGKYDIYHLFFTGGLLRKTPLDLYETRLLKLAGKKVILFPYGSDAFAISRIPYKSWQDILLEDYPQMAYQDAAISRKLDIFTKDADCVVGCLVHIVTLPRIDAKMLTCYPVDTGKLQPAYPDANPETLKIFHAPNHTAIKGTDYLVTAVDKLKAEGLPVELNLMQRRPHHEIIAHMRKADLVIDQLHFGYGLTAMEGMALGKMVISGRNPEGHDAQFMDIGLKDCPLIWSSPDDIERQLRELLADKTGWRARGQASRAYVRKYHSYASTARNWIEIYERLGM